MSISRVSALLVAGTLLQACGARPAGPSADVPPQPIADEEPSPASAELVSCPAPSPELSALVERLDADADPLHNDITPAVAALSAAGIAGACAVVSLLEAPTEITRLHAQRVLEGVLNGRAGWVAGRGYPDQYAEERVVATLSEVRYAFDASPESRREGAARWRRWLVQQAAAAEGPGARQSPAVAMRGALDGVAEALRRCGEPVDLRVTFDRSGGVESLFGHGESSPEYRECLRTATAEVRVAPLSRDRVWVRYPWVAGR